MSKKSQIYRSPSSLSRLATSPSSFIAVALDYIVAKFGSSLIIRSVSWQGSGMYREFSLLTKRREVNWIDVMVERRCR